MGIITFVKTQIIQLEAHDDTLSVQDKMDWAQAPRVLLVWPDQDKVLRNRLDLILLERYCSSHGSQLALQTKDQEVIFQAGKAGIPVFQTRREAQLQPWGKSFREFQRQDLQRYKSENPLPESLAREPIPPRRKLPIWARIPIFTVGVISVLAIAGTLLPNAEIQIQPSVHHKTMLIPFQAEGGGEEIGISGTVPGRELDIVVSSQGSIPTTGATAISSEYARGTVVFTNLGEGPVTIPKGTILSTRGEEPVLFQTLAEVKTPPGAGEEVQVEIEAQNPGESGNVAENQIQLINYQAGAELSVTNPASTTGGADLLIPAPTSEDQAELSEQVDQVLEENALEQIRLTLGSGDLLLSPDLGDYQILEESHSPAVNAPGDTLWLDRTVQYQVYYASWQDITALSDELILAQYQGSSYQPILESITIAKVTDPIEDQDLHYSWQMELSWDETPLLDQEGIISLILGKTTQQASAVILSELDLDRAPVIQTWPSWWRRIPALPFRITIDTGGSGSD